MSQMSQVLCIILAKMEFLGTPDKNLGHEFCLAACSGSLFLYAVSPIPTHSQIETDKSTGGRQPYSHCFTSFSCFLWMIYGITTIPKFLGICLFLVHCPCALLQFYYVIIFYEHTTPRNKIIMEVTTLIPEILLALMFPLWDLFIFRPHITGSVSAAFGIIMYASPIASIIDACMTRRTNYLPFDLCVMYLWNASEWFMYAYPNSPTYDVYLAIAHGSGMILQIFMLLVSCIVMVILKCLGTAMDDSNVDFIAPEDSAADLEAALLLHD